MRKLVLLLLGELPLNRTQAMYRYRDNVQNWGSCAFGQRSCLHCLLNRNTYVLDSEWHWIFDCPHFSAQRCKFPILSCSLMQVKTEVDGSLATFAVGEHVGDLMNVIRTDFSVGTSLASLLRTMIQIRQDWLVSVGCVRSRLCEAPDDWGRNLLTPPSAADLPLESRSKFESEKPFLFSFEDDSVFFWPYCGLRVCNTLC